MQNGRAKTVIFLTIFFILNRDYKSFKVPSQERRRDLGMRLTSNSLQKPSVLARGYPAKSTPLGKRNPNGACLLPDHSRGIVGQSS